VVVKRSTTYLVPVVVPLRVALFPTNTLRPVGLIVKLWTTAMAATWLVVSPWVAVNEQVPDDNMVTAIPETEQTEGVVEVIEGVISEVADAVTLNGVELQVFVPGLVKEIVFAARVIVTVCAEDAFAA
jgi:hypothetical protein